MNENGLKGFFVPISNEVTILVVSIIAVVVIMFGLIKNKDRFDNADLWLTRTFMAHYAFLTLWQVVYLFTIFENRAIENIFTLIMLIVLTIIGTKSFKIIKPNQMGIRVTLGEAGEDLGSGPNIAIWPIQKIVIVSTELQSIAFAVNNVMTKRGRVKGYEDIIESVGYSVLFTVYFQFNQDNLRKAIKNVKGFSEEYIEEELIPYTLSVLRALMGRVPWRLINEERYKFTQCALGRLLPLKGENRYQITEKPVNEKGDKIALKEARLFLYEFTEISDKDKGWLKDDQFAKSPYVQCGLENVSLAAEQTKFTDDEINKAVSAAEKSRLNKQAKKLDAEANAYEILKKGEAEATARQRMVDVIKNNPDLEVLLTLREMAQGTSNTLFYQLPSGVENKLRDLLGGNSPGDLTKFLNPEVLKALQKMSPDKLNELIKKLTK